MHLLHPNVLSPSSREVKILRKSRASFPCSIGRVAISRGAALFLWTARASRWCIRSIFSNTECHRVYRIGLSTHLGASLRVRCTFIERYPGASEARDGTSDAALLSRADEISRCSCPIIELQVVSDSQRVFTAQFYGLSFPRPPIIRHRIILHNELQIAHFVFSTMSRSFGNYSSKIAKYCCFKSSKK